MGKAFKSGVAYQKKEPLILLSDDDQRQQLDVETAQLNFERTHAAFQLGQLSNTGFREASRICCVSSKSS